ncbi:hypothetical protein VPH35_087707 [Triticum aestivum]
MAVSWIASLPPCSALPAANEYNVLVPAVAGVPLGSPAPTHSASLTMPAMATASMKIPLPVLVPETFPAHKDTFAGFNTETRASFGGFCGGFGYNSGPGYSNGPLFFSSAPATRLRLRRVAPGNCFAPLLVAGAAAKFYA